MKKISVLFLLTILTLANGLAGVIPAGKTIYLDASQAWCCHKSYYIFLSSKGNSYQMTPVTGKAGVYQYTTTGETQENFRFCYSDTKTGNQQGQVDPHTGDITGWSETRPYYIMTDDAGNGKWANQSSSQGETKITDATVQTSSDCVDSTYFVTVIVAWDGSPCLIGVSGDGIATPITKDPDGKRMEVSVIKGEKGVAGTTGNIKVTLYADLAGTQAADYRDLQYTLPDMMCEEQHDLGTICTDEQEQITMSSTLKGDHYAWFEGESTTPFASTESVTLDTKDGDQTYKVEVYKTILDPQRNLMANGDFEAGNDGSFQSTYTHVNYPANDGNYYESAGAIKNDIYTITSDASKFWRDFLAIKPHGGSKYALFDAGKLGYAWQTNTDINKELKLIKDSIYAFSFWVACPNPQHYFNKPAVLQFKICWKDASGTIQPEVNLGPSYTTTYKTGKEWTQVTADWTAPVDAEWVQIGVYDSSTEQQGNDFCLDDIMFQKVEIKTSNMAKRDIYTYFGKNCSCDGEPMYKKWNEVVFVADTNVANPYVAYQWFIDDQPVAGATSQYYRFTEEQLNHEIHAEMTCKDGTTKQTCPLRIADIQASAPINPAKAPAVVLRRTYQVGPVMQIIQTIYSDGSTTTEKVVL